MPNWNTKFLGRYDSNARAREGWGKRISAFSFAPAAPAEQAFKQAGKKKRGSGGNEFLPACCPAKRDLGREAAAHSASAEGQSRKFFYLKRKNKKGRGAPKNEWKNFLLCSLQGERRRWAGLPPRGRQLSSVPLEKGSSGVVKLHQYLTFRDFADFLIRAEREKVRKHWLAAQSAARQAEVRIPCDFKYLLCPIII